MTDTPAPAERPILRFYLSMSYDAQTHVMYCYAPSNWADMTKEEREKFLQDEADQWAHEKFDWGADVYDPAEHEGRAWESGGTPEDPEEMFD